MSMGRIKVRYLIWLISGVAIASLLLAILVLWQQPRWLINRLSAVICPSAMYYRSTDQPRVALTIDDGPDDQRMGEANTTQKILDVLAQHQAKATFFLISSRVVRHNQPLVAEMVRQGHELGNHLTVDQPSISLSEAEFAVALSTAEQQIGAAAGRQISLQWMRPGSGRCNREMAQIAKQQGYRIALGSRWPYDTSLPSSQFAVQHILANIQPGDIIVVHDYGPQGAWGNRTAATLTQLLPQLKQKGYSVVTLTDLFNREGDPR